MAENLQQVSAAKPQQLSKAASDSAGMYCKVANCAVKDVQHQPTPSSIITEPQHPTAQPELVA